MSKKDIQYKAERKKASSSYKIDESTWKHLWHTPFVTEVRDFLWRTLHNMLAVGENLEKRKLKLENNCPLCEVAN